MKSRPAAVPLHMKHAERRAPAVLSLVSNDTMASVAGDDTEVALLEFDDGDVIAGIVPVPATIPTAMREALERMMRLRWDTDRLDQWLHTDHPALRGATPFETLVAGDGTAVLRALLRSGTAARSRRRVGAALDRQGTLRLER